MCHVSIDGNINACVQVRATHPLPNPARLTSIRTKNRENSKPISTVRCFLSFFLSSFLFPLSLAFHNPSFPQRTNEVVLRSEENNRISRDTYISIVERLDPDRDQKLRYIKGRRNQPRVTPAITIIPRIRREEQGRREASYLSSTSSRVLPPPPRKEQSMELTWNPL